MLLKQIANLFCLCSLFGLVACGNSGTAPTENSSSISISSSSESIFSSSEGAYSSSSKKISSSSLEAESSSSSVVSSSSVESLNTDPCTFTSTGTIHGTTGTLACTEKTYKTIVIGNQTWMAENLAWLPSVHAKYDYSSGVPRYYVYQYYGTSVAEAMVTSEYMTYGTLYNYEAALSACPIGWHLPSDAEWQTLEVYLGMTSAETATMEWRGTDQGTQMKANGSLWSLSTNTSGFSALPGGYFQANWFLDLGYYAYFWTATNEGVSDAWMRYLYYYEEGVYRSHFSLQLGLSVRCLKNSN